jgi:hypothetical protein
MAAIVAADAPTTTMQYDGSISSEGKFHGKGSIVYSNGEKYAGDWEHGQRHGNGVYTYADGGSYDGQWDRDKISGEGRARYADGNVYEGSWVNGKIHGTGKLETSKFSYDGEWRDGKKHGEGSCRYHDNGDDYEGSWAEDKWHGHGVWTLRGEDGSVHEKFVGDMLNGQMHGNGRYQYADGSHYDGQWPVTCVEILRHRPGVVPVTASARWRGDPTPSTRQPNSPVDSTQAAQQDARQRHVYVCQRQ